MVIGLGLDQLDNVHGKDAEFENIKKKKKKEKNGAMLFFWMIRRGKEPLLQLKLKEYQVKKESGSLNKKPKTKA